MRRTTVALATATLALAAAAPAAARTHYVVRYGDTLTGIAHAHGISLLRLARLNHRRPFAVLQTGTVLVVPGRAHAGRTYRVRFGDTLTGIAARFGTSVERLARANGLAPRGVLLAGSTLRVRPAAGASLPFRGFRGRYRVRARRHTRPGSRPGSGSASAGLRAPTACTETGSCSPGSRCGCRPPRRQPAPVATGPWSVVAAIDAWSAHYGVDRELARAIAWQESGFQIDILSPAGAWGPMQVSRARGATSRTC